MKKSIFFTILICFTIIYSSCKSEKKEKSSAKTNTSEAKFSIAKAENEINFTAYKFTEKTPVGGQFRQVKILSGGTGNTIKEAINNTEFSIPISSLFTKDSSRDYKIQKFFFGVMESTKSITGKLAIENDSIGYAEIKMNNISKKVPFSYSINNNTFLMEGTIDVSNWDALNALNSLNKVCELLHTGTDGISKTWSDVALKISSKF